jgi:hypothetical protein
MYIMSTYFYIYIYVKYIRTSVKILYLRFVF